MCVGACEMSASGVVWCGVWCVVCVHVHVQGALLAV